MDRLVTGHHVAVHCRVGSGRSSLVAAALLVRLGTPPDQAWDLISGAHGVPVPETDQQRTWLDCLEGPGVLPTGKRLLGWIGGDSRMGEAGKHNSAAFVG